MQRRKGRGWQRGETWLRPSDAPGRRPCQSAGRRSGFDGRMSRCRREHGRVQRSLRRQWLWCLFLQSNDKSESGQVDTVMAQLYTMALTQAVSPMTARRSPESAKSMARAQASVHPALTALADTSMTKTCAGRMAGPGLARYTSDATKSTEPLHSSGRSAWSADHRQRHRCVELVCPAKRLSLCAQLVAPSLSGWRGACARLHSLVGRPVSERGHRRWSGVSLAAPHILHTNLRPPSTHRMKGLMYARHRAHRGGPRWPMSTTGTGSSSGSHSARGCMRTSMLNAEPLRGTASPPGERRQMQTILDTKQASAGVAGMAWRTLDRLQLALAWSVSGCRHSREELGVRGDVVEDQSQEPGPAVPAIADHEARRGGRGWRVAYGSLPVWPCRAQVQRDEFHRVRIHRLRGKHGI